jgi:hypothetical protein
MHTCSNVCFKTSCGKQLHPGHSFAFMTIVEGIKVSQFSLLLKTGNQRQPPYHLASHLIVKDSVLFSGDSWTTIVAYPEVLLFSPGMIFLRSSLYTNHDPVSFLHANKTAGRLEYHFRYELPNKHTPYYACLMHRKYFCVLICLPG